MASAISSSRIGVDVGGTFTDVILQGADGSASIRKVLSTPPGYDRAVVEAVAGFTASGGEIAGVVHGTTVATNAVLERRGALTALVTTAGFRDVLELRRLRIPHMYDPFWRKPDPLVPRRLRFELAERLTADGTVLRPVDPDEVRAIAARLREAGVESVAVCLLHSYRFPEHEEQAGALLREELPGVTVSLSSEILREEREYECSAITYDPESVGRRIPISSWFKLMGKTRHLCRPEQADRLESIETEIERRWQRLKAMNEHPLL